MDVLLELRKLALGFGPPASRDSIEDLENTLDADLPSDALELFHDHDGTATSGPLAVRLLSVREIRSIHDADPRSGNRGVCAMWTDDDSNYVGVYVQGTLTGRVCFITHEDPDLSPRYVSIRSFLKSLLEHPGKSPFFREIPEDYPAVDPSNDIPETVESDEASIAALEASLKSAAVPEDRQYYAFCIMALLRHGALPRLMKFARDRDMHIQARACEILGLWKHEPAIPLLAEIADHGSHNGIQDAILALGKIGTPDCLKELIRLAESAPGGRGSYFAAALKRCGCETGHVGLDWRYRLPGKKDWHPLP